MRWWLRREPLPGFVGRLGRGIVAMEVCCGAHHLGRTFVVRGHEVRLITPEYVRLRVKAHKQDGLDAEVATRPTHYADAKKGQGS